MKRSPFEIAAMAAPLMIENLATAVVSLVDAAVVGRLGAAPLAALGGAHAVWGVATAVPYALDVGSVVAVARRRGRGEDPAPAAAGACAAYLFVGAALAAALYLVGLPALGAMGLEEAAQAQARRYLAILSLVPLVFFAGAARSILLGLGRTRAMLAAGLAGHAVHLVLLPPLVLGWGGAPAMGVAGAAAATLAGSVAGGAVGLAMLGGPPPGILAAGAEAREVVRVGAPAAGEILLYGLAQGGVLRIAAALGTVPLAAFVVIRRAMGIPVTLEAGLAQAVMSRAGQAAGAGEARRAGEEGRAAGRIALAIAAAFAALFAGAGAQAAGVLADDPPTAATVAAVLPFAGVVLCPQAVNIAVGAALRGAGLTGWMLGTQALGIPVVLAATFVLGHGAAGRPGLGLIGVLLGLAVDEGVRAAANAWRLRRLAGP